jgi:hypothetical protein
MQPLYPLYLYLFFALLTPKLAIAEVADKYQSKAYKKGKKCYEAADYLGTQETLIPILESQYTTSLTPYAWFYYALAAYHQGDRHLAAEAFLKIYQGFSDWEQQDEVLYWLAQIFFEKQDYQTALAYLTQIRHSSFANSVKNLKSYFLQQIEDPNILKSLLQTYPTDPVLGQVLVDKELQQPYIKQDHALIDKLIQEFTLSVQALHRSHKLPLIKKECYNVAVFFPFFIHELNYEEEKSNQFVLNLYQGIVAAVKELATQGIQINLYAYDTRKDASTTAALLEQEEIKFMDLIIGPLYANTIPLVAEFAQKHCITMFNPLSCNAQVVGTNPFVYLFKPSLETQARRAAWLTQQNCHAAQLGIVYGTAAEDSIKAFTYKQYIEHSTDQQVALMLALDADASQKFLSMFRPDLKDNLGEKIDLGKKPNLDQLTHIYIASQDELIIANVLSALEIMGLKPYIIGDEAWLKNNSISLDQLQRFQFCFIAPEHINYDQETLKQFREDFYEQFGHYPDYYASIGYDMMLYLGNMLYQYGVYFQQHWPANVIPGKIFAGFCYGRHHDNQYVPIVQFQASALVLAEEQSSLNLE